jgi:hypothetical protein
MRFSHFLSASTIVTAALAADAPVITDNVPGVWAIANTPSGGDQDILAQVSVASYAKGGVVMTVNINGGPRLPGGPFCKSSIVSSTLCINIFFQCIISMKLRFHQMATVRQLVPILILKAEENLHLVILPTKPVVKLVT